MADELRLRDLRVGELRSFRRFTPAARRLWCPLWWAECPECGTEVYARTEHLGGIYDGEPLVCLDCGEVGHASVDEGDAHAVWDNDPCRLRPSALAGLRRLLGWSREDWWMEVERG